MVTRTCIRPGGRSARVQESVHGAVRALLEHTSREHITVPQIAASAGVTPSTIYRRWGDLQSLLADVAMQRMHPDAEPLDTGSIHSDLDAWAEQYQEEMSSAPGRAMIRDLLAPSADQGNAGRCAAIVRGQIQTMLDRAHARGEAAPDADTVLDHVIAPIVYRFLFDSKPLDPLFARTKVAAVMNNAALD